MKFLIPGSGGVGSFFGAKLLNAGEDVRFLARGKHLEASRSKGLRVLTTQGNFTVPPQRITDKPSEVGHVDVVLFCVKSYDTEAAAEQLIPVLTEHSIIIPLWKSSLYQKQHRLCSKP